jgi:mono/diheme cytochrome c family protein
MKGSILAALSLVLALASAAPAVGRGTQSGVYSAEQASEGAQLYARRCAMCHGASLEGTVETPELVGKFVANWADRPLANLYDYLARAMPQNAPGSLAPQDNARVVAFLLQANGAPAGKAPLPADSAALRRLSFDPVKRMGSRTRD